MSAGHDKRLEAAGETLRKILALGEADLAVGRVLPARKVLARTRLKARQTDKRQKPTKLP